MVLVCVDVYVPTETVRAGFLVTTEECMSDAIASFTRRLVPQVKTFSSTTSSRIRVSLGTHAIARPRRIIPLAMTHYGVCEAQESLS